ncbi:hypothetical protein NQZ68_031001 [Dissostichus eleginoides]|nr:hypothetical protein NQZ68_031001 [Dissostichus eleginoides]
MSSTVSSCLVLGGTEGSRCPKDTSDVSKSERMWDFTVKQEEKGKSHFLRGNSRCTGSWPRDKYAVIAIKSFLFSFIMSRKGGLTSQGDGDQRITFEAIDSVRGFLILSTAPEVKSKAAFRNSEV